MKDFMYWSVILINLFSGFINIYLSFRYKKMLKKEDDLKKISMSILRKVCSCYWEFLSPSERQGLKFILESQP